MVLRKNKNKQDKPFVPQPSNAPKPSPETAQRTQAAQEFVSAREKRAQELLSQGMQNIPKAQGIASKEILGPAQAEKEKQLIGQQKEQEEQETAAPIPQAVNIPANQKPENIISPFTGALGYEIMGAFGGGRALIASGELRGLSPEILKNLSELTKRMQETGETPEQLTNDPQLRNILNLQINDMDFHVLANGEAKIGALSQLIETLPILGRVGRYFNIAPLPESKVKTMLSTIDELNSQISQAATFALQNPALIDMYYKQIEDAEAKIYELESKIKLTAIQSPSLQSDPEQVNKIMESITKTKQSADISKRKVNIMRMGL